ncbi:hypothetical protein NIES3275_36230 [Microchaete diplosiphon NIES-3275]|nr:hypothetical protein NIES3275_36230 [Microchaete diplosiphon NIES-3275]
MRKEDEGDEGDEEAGEKLLLPITHYPLPITHYPLPITHYPFPMPHAPCPLFMPLLMPLPGVEDDIFDGWILGLPIEDFAGFFATAD